jgi:uncharacterized protein YjbI with pentapeptide repeats/DNA-binding Xre family transcriptional regulator
MIAEMLADKKTSSNMTDSSLPKKKKRVTLRASAQGIVTAEKSLLRLGFDSKSNFAASQRISRGIVTKFFQGKPIQLDSLKRICTALKLNWQEIAGMSVADEQQVSSGIELTISDEADVGKMPTLRRQVRVVDPNSKKVKAVITLEGDVDSVDNWEIIQLLLRQNSGSSVNIIDLESGSIRLTVEGSQADIQKLVDKIRSGELIELNELPVENIEVVTENLDDEKISKWDLAKDIIAFPVFDRHLSNANLSDTDLRSASLHGANLHGADLSWCDLSGATLFNADLSWCDLSGATLFNADLSDTDLRGSNLINTDLTRVNMRSANLSSADLSSFELKNANLMCANLNRANLRDTDLSDSNLSGANLIDADLTDSNLCSAQLFNADLNGAILYGADVKNTKFGNNLGISESMKLDLIQRGAIFTDSSGDRSETYALR